MIALLLVALVALGGVSAHDWGWGKCPKVDAIPHLSVDKFLGGWYVIAQFDTASTCYTYNYTRLTDTQLAITKSRQFGYIQDIGLDLDVANTYTGSLDIPDPNNPGKMRVKWPWNVAGKSDYNVIDTDYVNYAAVYDCQQLTPLGHRDNAAILSRTTTISDDFRSRIIRRLSSLGVSTNNLEEIDQTGCVVDADLNIDVDEDTLPDFAGDAADGIKDITKTVINGVNGFASSSGGQLEDDAQIIS